LKKLFFVTTIIFLFAGISLNAQDKTLRIAYVDSDIIVKQLPETEVVKKQIEDIQKQYVDTISAVESDIKTKLDTYKAKYEDAQNKVKEGKLTPDQITTLEAELGNMQSEIQKLDQGLAEYKQSIQQILVAKQQELFKPINDKVTKKIEEVAKELKFNFVFDKAGGFLIYGDKDYDLTYKIMEKLNK
jgi:outer membrane protein